MYKKYKVVNVFTDTKKFKKCLWLQGVEFEADVFLPLKEML